MRITTQQVHYFLAAAEEGNFTRAAGRCGVKQPTLSQSVKELESALGGVVFKRAHHGVQLTPLGRAVRPHLAAIARAAVKASQAAQSFCQTSDATAAREVALTSANGGHVPASPNGGNSGLGSTTASVICAQGAAPRHAASS